MAESKLKLNGMEVEFTPGETQRRGYYRSPSAMG